MAVALRGAAVVPAGNPTTGFTVVVPASVVANDLLFLTLTSRDSVGAGTLAVTDNGGGNAWAKIGNSTDHKATLWWKRATAGTAGATVTVANAVGSSSGVLKCFSGADTGATPYTNVVVETNASANETHAGFTPDAAGSMLCASVHNYANDNAVTTLAFATSGALNVTGAEKLSTGGSDCANIFGHVLQVGGPSATGNLTWAQTDGTTYSITWAIKPLALQNHTLAADSGTYAWTGTAATLSKGVTLGGSSGSVSMTGTAAVLKAARRLVASSVAFSWTGADATLDKVRALFADAGAVAWTGTAAGLRVTLPATNATFAWTGTAAGVRAARRVTAEASAVALTGIAAALDYSGAAPEPQGGPSIYVPARPRRGRDDEDEELLLLIGGLGYA